MVDQQYWKKCSASGAFALEYSKGIFSSKMIMKDLWKYSYGWKSA